jgi:hypothetical protein
MLGSIVRGIENKRKYEFRTPPPPQWGTLIMEGADLTTRRRGKVIRKVAD